MHAGREGRLLELLLDRLRLETLEPGGTYERAGVHEPAQLVAREQRLLQLCVPREPEMLGVREHGLDHLLGIALLAQDRGAVLRMLVERRVHLVVEVVEECRDAPELLVLTVLPGVRGCRSLDRERMPQERLALRLAREGPPGAFAPWLHR